MLIKTNVTNNVNTTLQLDQETYRFELIRRSNTTGVWVEEFDASEHKLAEKIFDMLVEVEDSPEAVNVLKKNVTTLRFLNRPSVYLVVQTEVEDGIVTTSVEVFRNQNGAKREFDKQVKRVKQELIEDPCGTVTDDDENYFVWVGELGFTNNSLTIALEARPIDE